jgi:excisionase family DNA binding protein
MMPQKLLTKKEAAEILNVSPRTINRLVAARDLKAVRHGRIFRVDPAEIERFMARNSS